MRIVRLQALALWLVIHLSTFLACAHDIGACIALGDELLYKVPRLAEDNRAIVAGIGVFPKGTAFIVAHDTDKRLVVCKQGKTGDLETVANFHLPEDGVPINAIPYGDSHVCVLDLKGRLWFFKISLSTGSVEQVKVMRFEKTGALRGPRPAAYSPKTATLYVCSGFSNEIWTLSVKDPNKPVLTQRATAAFPEALPAGEFGRPVELITDKIQGPVALAVSGDGRDLYLVNFTAPSGVTAPSLAQFRISQEDGTLAYSQIYDRTTIKGERRLVPHSILLPWAIAASPDGEQVYVGGLGNTIGIFNRDAESGALTLHDVLFPQLPGLSALDYIVAVRTTLDGRGIIVTCKDTGTIFVFDREANGKLKIRKQVGPKGDKGELAFLGLSDAVLTLDNDKVLFTSTGVILGAADARVAQPKK
ncbi:MAG: beta-propeller fold lactonase family protein [Pirellulaceae bacterium]